MSRQTAADASDLRIHKEHEEIGTEFYRALLDISNAVIVCMTSDCTITQWNREAERVFGWSRAEAIGADCQELIGFPNDASRMKEAIRIVLGGRPLWSHEVTKRARDGSRRVLLCNLTGTTHEDGKPRVLVVAQDITERVRIEERLRESEQRFRLLAETIQDVFWLRDAQTNKLLYLSPAYAAVWGQPIEQAYENPSAFIDAIHPIDQERVRTLIGRVPDGPVEVEYRVVRPDGKTRYLRDRAYPVRDQAGAAALIAGVACDVTELHERRAQQREVEEQLRIAQRLEPVGRLAGGIAHDFNNLLVAINGFSELAMAQLHESDPLRSDIQQIREAGELAAALTQQLLAFGRKQVIQPQLLDLNQVIRRFESMLKRLIGEDVNLQTIFHDPLGLIWADRSQIEQVIMNLVVNARDAMQDGGVVAIETRAGQDDVCLIVSDTGCGMDVETQGHIFEPFFTTKPQDQGTGLGLATVYGIVKQSGGTISVSSAPGEGAKFVIRFPRDTEHVPSRREKSVISNLWGTESILLVDDDQGVRLLGQRALSAAGFSVRTASDAFEALKIANNFDVNLLLTDVVMPKMGGRELSEHILARHPLARVLFMSGYNGGAVAQRGVLAPSVPFLLKPFTPAELIAKVREVLDRPGRRNDRRSTGSALALDS